MNKNKLKIAIYWAAACGGCDVAITHIHEKILDLIEVADIVFWPCAMDFKYDDVAKMAPGEIDVCLFSGAIRNSDHETIAKLLREKSKTMIAFGACACFGGIPGLANVATAAQSFERAYLNNITTPNAKQVLPKIASSMPEGELELPVTWDTVQTLAQTVPVEYLVPGCPPPPELVSKAVDAIMSGNLPPVGATIAADRALCHECGRTKKDDMRVNRLVEPWEVEIDPEQCLLEQGIVCLGPATRGGCGAQCISVNMPCRGCFGPPPGVEDQGAAMLSALASVVQTDAEAALGNLLDPLGSFYRFTLPDSTLKRVKM